MIRDNLGIAIVAVIAFALVASLLTSNYNGGVQNNGIQNLPSNTSAVSNTNSPLPPGPFGSAKGTNGVVQGGAPIPSPPLTVHSVASVEKTLNRTLILPSSAAVSSIDPSLKLLGVAFDDNTSPQQWMVSIIYSDHTFVNGTSTTDDLGANAIYISEVPVPLGVNSSQVAHEVLAPPINSVCTTIKAPATSTVQCSTSTGAAGTTGDYIVTLDGLSILVNPTGNVSWADGRRGIGVVMESAGLSITQLLNLASTMTSTS